MADFLTAPMDARTQWNNILVYSDKITVNWKFCTVINHVFRGQITVIFKKTKPEFSTKSFSDKENVERGTLGKRKKIPVEGLRYRKKWWAKNIKIFNIFYG